MSLNANVQLSEPTTKSNALGKNIFIKTNSHIVKIFTDEILWIEALGNYVNINTEKGKHTIHTTMKTLIKKLSGDNFVRVHRSFIVNIEHVSAIQGNILVVKTKIVPIGKTFRKALMQSIKFI